MDRNTTFAIIIIVLSILLSVFAFFWFNTIGESM